MNNENTFETLLYISKKKISILIWKNDTKDKLYENEFIPNGSDISPMSLNWKYSSLAVMGRNGNKTPNISAGCDKADAACSFSNLISNLPNKFGNKIRKERNNTLRHIIYVDGKEDSFPIENAARKAWFYTNTHKVKINFI